MSVDSENAALFRDVLQPILVQKLLTTNKPKKRIKGRKHEIKPVVVETDLDKEAADLIDFTEVGKQTTNGRDMLRC